MIDRTVRRLLETGDISPEYLQYALEEQHITNESIIKILLKKGYITEARIKDALEIYEEEDIDINQIQISPGVLKMLPFHLIKNNKIFPLKFENNTFVLGMVDPKDLISKDTVNIFLGKNISMQRFKISEKEHELLVNKYNHIISDHKDHEVINEINHVEVAPQQLSQEVKHIENSISTTMDKIPIEKIVNKVLENALNKKALQISAEPSYDFVRIRFKIDDTFYEEARLPKKMYQNFIGYMKELANLKLEDNKNHYSGHFKFLSSDQKEINFVMNGIKTVHGDKLILRPGYPIPDLKKLFYYPEIYEYINKVIEKNRGLVLVIGNAGSGKSTTLYSILQHKISTKYQLMTIEDPVRYIFDNYISQVEVKKDGNGKDLVKDLVYEVSRHNPDVLMIQEIKDETWSSLVEEVALSGMLVLTSMRAYNVLSAFKRLKTINFPNFASIQCIINQKLLKKLCPYCKIKSILNEDELKILGYKLEQIPAVYKADPNGCQKCYGGYHDIIGIFEVVKITREMISLLNKGENQWEEIGKLLGSASIMTFKEYAGKLLMDGVISFEELNKI